MTRAIIFDFFGVIVEDALKALRDSLPLDRKQQGIDILHASHRGLITPEESNRQLAEILGLSVEEYRAKVREGEPRNQALLDYIIELRKQHMTAVLSNISSGGLLRRFKAEELARYFDIVVASSDIGYAKPEAEAYEIVAERLGVRLDECVFTDDNAGFCEAARGVGMKAILYKDFAQFKAELEELLAISN